VSAQRYATIWSEDGFPLVRHTKSFAKKLEIELHKSGRDVEVTTHFLFTDDDLVQQMTTDAELLIVPLFPQFSSASTLVAIDAFEGALRTLDVRPKYRLIQSFFATPEYIESCVTTIESYLGQIKIDHLLLSYHSIPESRVTNGADPYLQHCTETTKLILAQLKSLSGGSVSMSFQSRLRWGKWLSPATKSEVLRLLASGKRRLAIFAPSFTADCLETLEELGIELKDLCHHHGGELSVISSLNDQDHWVKNFSKFLSKHLS